MAHARELARVWAACVGVTMALGVSTAASAAIVGEDALFRLTCTEKAASGFRWSAGAWAAAKFKPGRFVVERLDARRADCAVVLEGETGHTLSSISLLPGCYSIRPAETSSSGHDGSVCKEAWSTAGEHVLVSITCLGAQTLVVEPEGIFHRSIVSTAHFSHPGPHDDEADEMSVSFGTCRLDAS